MTKIQQIRVEKQMTRDELGKLSHTSGNTIKRIERGDAEMKNVRIGTLANIARALNVRLNDVVEDEFLR